MDISVKVKGAKETANNFKKRGAKVDPVLKKILKTSLSAISKDAKSRTKSKTVRKAYKVVMSKGGRYGKVSNKSPLAHLLELGVKAHIILPKKKRYLAFKPVTAMTLTGQKLYTSAASGKLVRTAKKSRYIRTLKVNHPGIAARPALKPAFEKEKNNFLNNIKKELAK